MKVFSKQTKKQHLDENSSQRIYNLQLSVIRDTRKVN